MKQFLVLVFLVWFIAPVMAQKVSVDLTDLSSSSVNEILKVTRDKELKAHQILAPENAAKWAEVGKQLSEGVAATARGLSIEVNEFVKTPVGKFTFFLLAWKFFGAKLWSVFAATIIWIVLGGIIWRSFRWFHRPVKYLVSEEGKIKKYEWVYYQWKSQEAKVVSTAVHTISFIVLSVVMITTIV